MQRRSEARTLLSFPWGSPWVAAPPGPHTCGGSGTGASDPPSSSSGGGGEGKISSSRGAGGNGSSIGGGGGGKAPPREPSASSPSPRRGGGGKGRSGVDRRKRAVSQQETLYPFPKFPSFYGANPQPPRTLSGVQGEHWVRTGRGLGAGVVQLPLHFGKQTRRGRFMPHIPASHPPGEGLGPVPGALAPSHELHDEVRTSARDRVAAPSPLRCNLSRFPKPVPPARRPPGFGPPARPAYLPGAAGGSRPPGPSVRAGPRRPGEPRCPRAGKDSLWALGPLPGRTSSAGRKKPEPRPRRRSRETGGGPPWPGRAAGGGWRGDAAPRRAEDPPRARPPASPPGGRLPAPHRWPELARRVSGGRLGTGSTDSASRSRAAYSRAGEGRRAEGGGRGRGERGAETIQGAAPRGGGERRGGRTRQETPPGRGPGPAPGPKAPPRSSRPRPRRRRPGPARTTPPRAQASDVIS